ncbi:MAG: 16S rRNA (guanine(527)-N(7))-methyltransferase RsmG [Desulfuromusa sp.]|nr:16S rRNA (guanine(527)-N(7))-methyltransferase RsmG [Desulfuromusa sp.]
MLNYLTEGLTRAKIELPEETLVRELRFLEELLRWNKRVNLTSVHDSNEAIEKHLIDSLLVMPCLGRIKSILDMGSGGGLPGIPLAIAEPEIKVDSIDSVGKKVHFQKHIKRLLQLDNFTVVQSRVEDLNSAGLGGKLYDLIICRAFTSLDTYIGFAAPWLKSGGRLLAMKGPEGCDEIIVARETIQRLKLSNPLTIEYSLPFSAANRQIIVIKKPKVCMSDDNRG